MPIMLISQFTPVDQYFASTFAHDFFALRLLSRGGQRIYRHGLAIP